MRVPSTVSVTENLNAPVGLAAVEHLRAVFGDRILHEQLTCDEIPTLWVARESIQQALTLVREQTFAGQRFEMLLDLTAIDERVRVNRAGQPASEFTVESNAKHVPHFALIPIGIGPKERRCWKMQVIVEQGDFEPKISISAE